MFSVVLLAYCNMHHSWLYNIKLEFRRLEEGLVTRMVGIARPFFVRHSQTSLLYFFSDDEITSSPE